MRTRTAADLGRIARQQRRDLGISQTDLAQRADVTRQWLVRFERGNTEVTLSKVYRVLRELGLTLRADADGSGRTTVAVPRAAAYRLDLDPDRLARVRDRLARGSDG